MIPSPKIGTSWSDSGSTRRRRRDLTSRPYPTGRNATDARLASVDSAAEAQVPTTVLTLGAGNAGRDGHALGFIRVRP